MPKTGAGPGRSARLRPRLGQHFLRDAAVVDQILRAIPADGLPIIEIGAGEGVLTLPLCALGRPLAAVELDEGLARRTARRLPDGARCALVAGDILDQDARSLLARVNAEPPYGVVGNLPYAITALLMRKFLSTEPDPPRWLVVMVQREVAAQMVAAPGKRSMLSIAVQLRGAPRVLFPVPPHAFQPPPRVWSSVVMIPVAAAPVVELPSEARFWEVVRAGFRAPRKQLHNALAMGLWLPPGGAQTWLDACGIDPARRAGTLSIAEWARLAWWRERSGAPAPRPEAVA